MPETVDSHAVIAGRLDQANERVVGFARSADAEALPNVLNWLNLDRWRATEAIPFWVHALFLVMRFGQPSHLRAIRRNPGHEVRTEMHRWLDRTRKLVARVVALRAGQGKRTRAPDGPIPTTKAKMKDHIAAALGDPGWDPSEELVAFIRKPKFNLVCEEGLYIHAALLLHGRPDALTPLIPLAAEDALIAQLLRSHGIKTAERDAPLEADLLRAVYAEPTSDAARSVYADWLAEQGQPRGEFIALQLGGRSANLSDKQARAWMGPLRGSIRWKNTKRLRGPRVPFRYERGFLCHCTVSGFRDALGASEWSTLEAIDLMGAIDGFDACRFPVLCALGGLHSGDLETVLRAECASRLIAIGINRITQKHRDLVWEQLEQMPQVRALSVGPNAIDHLDPVWSTPFGERLRVLRVYGIHTPTWLARVPKRVVVEMKGDPHGRWLREAHRKLEMRIHRTHEHVWTLGTGNNHKPRGHRIDRVKVLHAAVVADIRRRWRVPVAVDKAGLPDPW